MVFAYSEPGVTKSAEVTGAEGVAAAAEAPASIATARTLTSIADDLRTSTNPLREILKKALEYIKMASVKLSAQHLALP